ncbi:MAG: cytidine deaminase [Deltaproteobacteria bacterium]|nr:cytidine deaminase [Deltaproteobacteria bacterium]
MNTTLSFIKLASEIRVKAYAPYSRHRVGACLVTQDDHIFLGVNVENCSFPLGVCAERVAIYKAVSEGYLKFKKLVLVTGNEEISAPCGGCRQVIREFAPDLEIIVANPKNLYKTFFLKDLLPHAFSPESYLKGQDPSS